MHVIKLAQKECGPVTITKMEDWAIEQGTDISYNFSPAQMGLTPPDYIYWHFKNEKDKIAFSLFFTLGC